MAGEQGAAHGSVGPQDLESVLAARRDLGEEYEPALVESFVERIEDAIEARVDARLAERRERRSRADDRDNRQMVLGIVSLGTGIPITAIAGETAEAIGVFVAWAGIAAVNASYAWQTRRRPD